MFEQESLISVPLKETGLELYENYVERFVAEQSVISHQAAYKDPFNQPMEFEYSLSSDSSIQIVKKVIKKPKKTLRKEKKVDSLKLLKTNKFRSQTTQRMLALSTKHTPNPECQTMSANPIQVDQSESEPKFNYQDNEATGMGWEDTENIMEEPVFDQIVIPSPITHFCSKSLSTFWDTVRDVIDESVSISLSTKSVDHYIRPKTDGSSNYNTKSLSSENYNFNETESTRSLDDMQFSYPKHRLH
ncbi:hypothetical protein HDV01_002471 [Terramyces sp. JEL0728]|nr:hypothetical protein HDV01_002471 [Terramyces sp. JEL0728]